MNPSILIIEDDPQFLSLITRIISKEGFKVLPATDGKTGLMLLEKEQVTVVLCDVHLPDYSGVQLVETIKAKWPFIEVLVITNQGSIEDGVQSMKNGAFDYLQKGADNARLIPLLSKAIEKSEMQTRIYQLEKQVSDKYSFENIIGQSEALEKTKALAAKVAQTDATVLLLGESGTGKEVFAQAIHHTGKRKLKPFVAVNCSAFGKDILESELFGHKAGAFTGAVKDKTGYLEEANGGTIFLDEIGEMNIDLQAKLLRVLESQEFYKVGDPKPTKVNVRIIAATNRQLEAEAEKGNFRADLFYRLSVFQIHLPSLNNRTEDIDDLVKYFLKFYAGKLGVKVPKAGKEFMNALKKHPWRGNVRELKNVIERAMILCDGELLPEHLPFDTGSGSAPQTTYNLAEVERLHITKVLKHTRDNKTEAARLLGIGLTTLYRKLQEYGLESAA